MITTRKRRRGKDYERFYGRQRPLVAWFYDEVYQVNIYLFRCPHDKFEAAAKREFGKEFSLAQKRPASGKTMVHYDEKKGRRYYIIWMPPECDVNDSEWLVVIAHEALHLVFFILLERGLVPTMDEHEAFTYYDEWLLAECLKHYGARAPRKRARTCRKTTSRARAAAARRAGSRRRRSRSTRIRRRRTSGTVKSAR